MMKCLCVLEQWRITRQSSKGTQMTAATKNPMVYVSILPFFYFRREFVEEIFTILLVCTFPSFANKLLGSVHFFIAIVQTLNF